MSKHTFGPWKADEMGRVLDAQGFYIATADDTAVLSNWGDRDWGEQQVLHWADLPGVTYIERGEDVQVANAKLMAAAPDLHDALERLVYCLTNGIGVGPNTLKQARAALAKARGEAE